MRTLFEKIEEDLDSIMKNEFPIVITIGDDEDETTDPIIHKSVTAGYFSQSKFIFYNEKKSRCNQCARSNCEAPL